MIYSTVNGPSIRLIFFILWPKCLWIFSISFMLHGSLIVSICIYHTNNISWVWIITLLFQPFPSFSLLCSTTLIHHYMVMWRHVDLSHSTIFHFVILSLSNFFYIFLSYGSVRLLLAYNKGLLSFHALSNIHHILFSKSVHSTYLHIFTSCTSIMFISLRFRFDVNTLYFQLSLVLCYNFHSFLNRLIFTGCFGISDITWNVKVQELCWNTECPDCVFLSLNDKCLITLLPQTKICSFQTIHSIIH